MEIITVPPTQTRVGLRPAYVLGDPEVWSSAFEVALQDQGFAVAAFRELHELFDRSHDAAPDLLILAKRNAPFAVRACQAVRGLRDAPIIVVIASESDFVPAMDAGADDAVTASSDAIVFTTRVRALLRRAQHWQTGQSAGIIVIRDLLIDLDKCESGPAEPARFPDAHGVPHPRCPGGQSGQGGGRPLPAVLRPRT